MGWLITDILLGLTFLAICWLAFEAGLLYNFLNIYLLYRIIAEVAKLVVNAIQGKIGFDFWIASIQSQGALYYMTVLAKILFFAIVLYYVSNRIFEYDFSPQEYKTIQLIMILVPLSLMILSFIPQNRNHGIQLTVYAAVSIFISFHLIQFSKTKFENMVNLNTPFIENAVVVQGGASPLFNHHYSIQSQRFALDMILAKPRDNGASATNNTALENYVSFGTPLISPANGKIVKIVQDLKDVEIGKSDLNNIVGNQIVIDIDNGQYLLLAHIKQNSVAVKLGDQVIAGETLLAQCGNSGNTTQPHLHIQVQDAIEFSEVTKTFPINFINAQGQFEFARANDIVKSSPKIE